ncbi:MAG: anaerobic ribonucleoside-triphosphate reductase activating protein [Deltaproteobacteria bacterium]|nr:anaerobic ribonucleoside-triphosphate reductase activating protein [Deltaproteobacteria bacterium]
MLIADILKTSLIDFPGKVCAVVFTGGCNFSCPFCHNPHLVHFSGEARWTAGQALAFFENRTNFLDGVTVTGGEPTLHPDLGEFLQKIKDLGLLVKLDTNGSRPRVLENILSAGLADFLAMDVKTLPGAYPATVAPGAEPASILESIRLVKESGLDHEFRTTCVPGLVDADTVDALGPILSGARAWAFQSFRDERTLSPDRIPSARYTREDLEAFAARAEPWVKKTLVR